MPIKPIDIVTMPPKSQEVSFYKQHEVQKPLNEQMHLNNQLNNEIRHNQQQATKTIKSENTVMTQRKKVIILIPVLVIMGKGKRKRKKLHQKIIFIQVQ